MISIFFVLGLLVSNSMLTWGGGSRYDIVYKIAAGFDHIRHSTGHNFPGGRRSYFLTAQAHRLPEFSSAISRHAN